jgi:hypothetical protein
MAIAINRSATGYGYGQIEPNHLSGQRTGQIYAQYPAASAFNVLENGMFVKYDGSAGTNGQVNLTGAGEWMLVFNEEKLYDLRQTHKDFALVKTDFIDGVMTPRVYKTNVGDIITTNTVATDADYTVGNYLNVDASTGILKVGTLSGFTWEVIKETTMPDGQPAVKLQRVL